MAKMKSQKNLPTHIPTHIGFGIMALVALVVGLLIVTQYNTTSQHTVGSQAAGTKTPIVKPIAPVTTVNTSQKCISYNTSGKCVMYQTTTTAVNTKSPCISYNTSGQCTYYQGTTQTTKTWMPTPQPVQKKCTIVKKCLYNKSGVCIGYSMQNICK